jgi:hypothetical protein
MSAVQSKISSRMTAVESTSVMRQRQFATEEKSGDMLIVPLSRPDLMTVLNKAELLLQISSRKAK